MPEQSGNHADDAFDGRAPTSHERMTGLPWDASYQNGPAPWDVGHPQQAIVRLVSKWDASGPVLDVGCGTGDHAILVASQQVRVLGVDVAGAAIAEARRKAIERNVDVEFAVADALRLDALGRTFATVLDCGLFHTFDAQERLAYAASLASVTERDGALYVLCFSDRGPETGPHPISANDLNAAFNSANGWKITSLEAARIETRFHDHGAPGWLATIRRQSGAPIR